MAEAPITQRNPIQDLSVPEPNPEQCPATSARELGLDRADRIFPEAPAAPLHHVDEPDRSLVSIVGRSHDSTTRIGPKAPDRLGVVERRRLPQGFEPRTYFGEGDAECNQPGRVRAIEHERRDEHDRRSVYFGKRRLGHHHASPLIFVAVVRRRSTHVDDLLPVVEGSQVIGIDQVDMAVFRRLNEDRGAALELHRDGNPCPEVVVDLGITLHETESGTAARGGLQRRIPG
ncbi:MAG TPA: hypothetical protein EYQ27_16235 [Gemmatimonadetes bacterium]|nr:hypothetical protein [Gemmatimonadota bacterium]